MKCENELCIYQHCGACTLQEIRINELGMCDQCILLTMDTPTLTTLKIKALDKLDD